VLTDRPRGRWSNPAAGPRTIRGVKFQHLILTRYAVKGLFYDEFSREWLEERLRVFRAYCVPGMAQQTVGDFSWLVLFDETTDRDYLDRVRESARFVPQLRIVTTSHKRKVPLPKAIAPFIDDDTQVLITTRLDSDDSLNRETAAVLRAYVEAFVASPRRRWIVNFPRGYRYDDQGGRLYAAYWPYSPFSTLFERLDGDRRRFNVYRNHHKLHLHLPVHFDESIAGWMQVIHGLAESTEPGRRGRVVTAGNRDSVVRKDTDIEVALGATGDSFGIDLRQNSAVPGGDDPEAGS
jgi:hypothetical protein